MLSAMIKTTLSQMSPPTSSFIVFFLNDPPPPETYPLSLPAALPIGEPAAQAATHGGRYGKEQRPPRPEGRAGRSTGDGRSAPRPGDAGPGGGRSGELGQRPAGRERDRKSTRLNSSHSQISYAVFCLK